MDVRAITDPDPIHRMTHSWLVQIQFEDGEPWHDVSRHIGLDGVFFAARRANEIFRNPLTILPGSD